MPQRKWTPEQRKEASDRAKARMTLAQAGPTVEFRTVKNLTPATVAETDEDEGDDVLSQLMATLQAAKNKKVKQSTVLKQLGELLDQIDPKEHPELADDPIVAAFIEQINGQRIKQAEKLGLPPGTQIGSGIAQDGVPWKYTDLPRICRRPLPGHEKDWRVFLPGHEQDGDMNHTNSRIVEEFSEPDLITFIPNELIPVTVNGLTCWMHPDEPLTTYKVFYDVYMEHKRLNKVGDQHKAYMFGRSNEAPRELLQGDQGMATAKVRAYMAMGDEMGTGRIIQGYQGDADFGIREAPSGEAQA